MAHNEPFHCAFAAASWLLIMLLLSEHATVPANARVHPTGLTALPDNTISGKFADAQLDDRILSVGDKSLAVFHTDYAPAGANGSHDPRTKNPVNREAKP